MGAKPVYKMERTSLKLGKGPQIYCKTVTRGERAVADRKLENLDATLLARMERERLLHSLRQDGGRLKCFSTWEQSTVQCTVLPGQIPSDGKEKNWMPSICNLTQPIEKSKLLRTSASGVMTQMQLKSLLLSVVIFLKLLVKTWF